MVVFLIMCSANIACVSYSNGFYTPDYADIVTIIYFIIIAWFTGRFSYVESCELKSHQIVQNRFKKIMDQSGEGIIIMNDKNIEYINDTFTI